MEKRDELLLDAISNLHSLPVKEQRKLRPLLAETIDRHRKFKRDREVRDRHMDNFLNELKVLYKVLKNVK